MTGRPDPRLGTELGPYRIEAVLGRGGMGVVYLATHTGLDRRVALKLLSPDYAEDEAFRARFLRESKLAAAIDHPNIIPIYDAGEIEGTYYLAMRYVDGIDLETRLRSGSLEPREVVRLLAQVASALDAANEAGLVHRDVKPANVLIASGKGVDRADHAYLTDFGLTKHRGSQTGLTRAGSFLGTLEYIAPEQIEGKPVDGRVDQYALAAIAVGCLTGQPPFPRDSDIAIINAHLRDAPPSLHERRIELPAAVDAVIARGLAKKPEDRYPDCKAFVDDLRAALGVTATQPRARPSGSTTRRRIVLGTVALATIILVAGGVWLAAGGSGPGASPSPSPTTIAASNGPGASPTEDVFPNVAETALLAALPEDLKKTCSRGPYGQLSSNLQAVPLASLSCEVPVAAGASEVLVRRFTKSYPKFYVNEYAGSNRIPEGDCATSTRAHGVWAMGGEDVGSTLCYIDLPTGDAILYWTYDDPHILVRATNQRGDSAALYAYFQSVARFISP
jgi:serine/threonine-protein kinase